MFGRSAKDFLAHTGRPIRPYLRSDAVGKDHFCGKLTRGRVLLQTGAQFSTIEIITRPEADEIAIS